MERRTNHLVRKVCVLGDAGVGKTSLVRRYLSGTFDPEQRPTVGTLVSGKTVLISSPDCALDIRLKLCVWDITGHRRFLRAHRLFLRGSHGAMVVADATRPQTLYGTIDWLEDLREEAGKVPVVLVLNKMDILEKKRLDIEFLKDICAGFGCELRLASARTGQNVHNSFERLLRKLAGSVLDGASVSGSRWTICA
ncbi:MAG: Rab family GTPase [Thermoplasmata archaeon]